MTTDADISIADPQIAQQFGAFFAGLFARNVNGTAHVKSIATSPSSVDFVIDLRLQVNNAPPPVSGGFPGGPVTLAALSITSRDNGHIYNIPCNFLQGLVCPASVQFTPLGYYSTITRAEFVNTLNDPNGIRLFGCGPRFDVPLFALTQEGAFTVGSTAGSKSTLMLGGSVFPSLESIARLDNQVLQNGRMCLRSAVATDDCLRFANRYRCMAFPTTFRRYSLPSVSCQIVPRSLSYICHLHNGICQHCSLIGRFFSCSEWKCSLLYRIADSCVRK